MNNVLLDQPMRGGQSRSGDWIAHNHLQSDARYGRGEMIASRDKLAQLDKDDFMDGYFYPFKIYSFPSVWRAAPNISVDWLSFRVHAGRFQGIIVAGTDGHDEDPSAGYTGDFPDLDYPLAEKDVADIAVPAGTQQYWFWIDATNSGAPVLKSGSVGLAVNGNQGDPIRLGWASFPTPDGQHIPIGWVDTLTDQADKNPYVRQYLRGDSFPSGGGGVSGVTFDPNPFSVSRNYAVYTIVQNTAGPGTLGTWISIIPIIANAGQIPTWPLPSASGGTDSWRPFAFGVIPVSVCDNGTKTSYLNATPPA